LATPSCTATTKCLWHEPDHGDNPYKSAAFSDLLATTFLIAFFTVALSTKGIRDAMKAGYVVPVDREMLQTGFYRCVPSVNMLGTCSRSLTFGLWATAVLGLPFLVLLEVVCAAGGMHDSGDQCSMEKTAYIYVKGAYAAVVAFIIYPFVLLMTLNTATLPPLDLTFFVQNQREKWDKEQLAKAPEPM